MKMREGRKFMLHWLWFFTRRVYGRNVMPGRHVVARELAEIFKIIAHPDRIRMIEELRSGEKDVNTLAKALDLPGARVSQHLSLMRAHRLVEERRDGRHHFYHLTQPEIAGWIVDGLDFVEGRVNGPAKSSIKQARRLWSAPSKTVTP
ncbi:ArsR/SmtB family transcription factor [Hyphococcus sp.]|uniref:ArsR/SmtB family transcription factor n=1 Tax=Hyphococcus sp. TaxID=2038636 RepID=UPI003CCBAE1A